jgi:DNA-directed RNA polymerase subunit RPC12/RpoP
MTRIACPECSDGILDDPPPAIPILNEIIDLKTAMSKPLFVVDQINPSYICIKCRSVITVVTCIEVLTKDGNKSLRKL